MTTQAIIEAPSKNGHANPLAKLEQARRLLAECRSVEDAKHIADIAAAAVTYAREAKLGEEAERYAREIRLRAERRMGEILIVTPRNEGGQPMQTQNSTSRNGRQVDIVPTLSELGITRDESSKAQKLAALPEVEFERVVSGEVAISKVMRSLGTAKREAQIEKLKTPSAFTPSLIVGKAEDTGLPAESVELIVTSPPYNLSHERWPMGGEGRTEWQGVGYDAHNDGMPEDEYQSWQLDVLIEMYRVAKPGASFFYNHKVRQKEGEFIHPLDWLRLKRNPWTLRQEIIWDRGSTHNHCASLFWPEDERIYWMTKGDPALPDRSVGLSTIWRFHGPEANTWHPAPFPDELPRRVFEAVGRPGITVLDPFAGSGTTLRVAQGYDFNAIGVDVSAEYVERVKAEYGW